MRHAHGAVMAALLLVSGAPPTLAQDTETSALRDDVAYRAAALRFPDLVNSQYAYLDRLPSRRYVLTPKLQQEAEEVASERDLLAFLERAILLLADHHAITGSSFRDSWAVVPSYSDLWIERIKGDYVITAVRTGSPAARAGIVAGDRLVAIGGMPTDDAVAHFWADLGLQADQASGSFAARVLAAGRRDRSRELTTVRVDGTSHDIELASMYQQPPTDGLLEATRSDGRLTVVFHNSLGEAGTISAFDTAMTQAGPGDTVVLDLTRTPGGGNTVVARAIMGWFADAPTPYQRHELPREERQTGIARSWLEMVEPREGKHHRGPVIVKVGRWTGSMGEGLALGMAELGACVEGGPMAGLLGAIEDFDLGGIVVKLPFERLLSVDGIPREDFEPAGHCTPDMGVAGRS